MFTKLILEAAEEVENERTPMKKKEEQDSNNNNYQDVEVVLKLPKQRKNNNNNNSRKKKSEAELYREFIASQTIVEKVSEYLFDLFDANLTEDFKKMQAFEKLAIKAFNPDIEEYTFKQEELHQEFCSLFEQLVGSFLKKEGYTYEEFYEEAKKSIDENNTKVHNNELIPNAFKKFQPSQKQMAEEIHGVILAVSNFQLWADEMREIRRNEMEQLLLDKKK